jgi:hypothetical protein
MATVQSAQISGKERNLKHTPLREKQALLGPYVPAVLFLYHLFYSYFTYLQADPNG